MFSNLSISTLVWGNTGHEDATPYPMTSTPNEVGKTHQVIWDALQDYGRIELKQTLSDLEKALDVAYQDVLSEFDLTWGVKGLIMIRSNLVVTRKVRPHMGIVS